MKKPTAKQIDKLCADEKNLTELLEEQQSEDDRKARRKNPDAYSGEYISAKNKHFEKRRNALYTKVESWRALFDDLDEFRALFGDWNDTWSDYAWD